MKYKIFKELLSKNQDILDFMIDDFDLINEHEIIRSLQTSRDLITNKLLNYWRVKTHEKKD